jgi:menaquinone-dependent protoporphyrinogen IX oxidase
MQPGEIASYIIYSSPAGTTRHAALIIAGALKEMGSPAHLWDLGKRSDCLEAEDHIKDLSKDCCL